MLTPTSVSALLTIHLQRFWFTGLHIFGVFYLICYCSTVISQVSCFLSLDKSWCLTHYVYPNQYRTRITDIVNYYLRKTKNKTANKQKKYSYKKKTKKQKKPKTVRFTFPLIQQWKKGEGRKEWGVRLAGRCCEVTGEDGPTPALWRRDPTWPPQGPSQAQLLQH